MLSPTNRLRWCLVTASLGALAGVLFSAREASPHNPVRTTVAFNREVATIFNAKCLACHADAGMAMSLDTFDEARPWAVAIKEEVLARRMPPWPAERGYGAFANDGGLTAREQEFLISWIDGGTPEGSGSLPPYLDHRGHWRLGEPERILTAASAAATETRSGSTRFVVDPAFAAETWVRAIDLQTGENRNARAAFFSIVETGEYLGGWTPLHGSGPLPTAAAYRVPRGSRIAVDVVHGSSPPPGSIQLGLYLAPASQQRLTTVPISAAVAAGERRAHASLRLDRAATVTGFAVELDEGGKSIELRARRPDGSIEPLVWIRQVRPDWRVPFVLKKPVTLPAGSELLVTAYFNGTATLVRRATARLTAY